MCVVDSGKISAYTIYTVVIIQTFVREPVKQDLRKAVIQATCSSGLYLY